jgi:hypothetical protein
MALSYSRQQYSPLEKALLSRPADGAIPNRRITAADVDPTILAGSEEDDTTHLRVRGDDDPQVRYSAKRERGWVGYKTQLSETSEEAEVHLITINNQYLYFTIMSV